MTRQKNISILGATGSIGASTLSVIRQHYDRYRIISLTCHSSVEKLCELVHEFRPEKVSVHSTSEARHVRDAFPELEVFSGKEGLINIAEDPDAQIVVAGIVGSAGLFPTFSAVSSGKNVALANKEPLVMAGRLFIEEASKSGAKILPTDSEHNAIFQVLNGRTQDKIRKLVLTASGGPFRDLPLEQFPHIRLEDALSHPNWEMGNKITIDSATMMNKGLEVIEARWLFDMPVEKIEVVIHRESIIHSMVEFCDGSTLAQLGFPDMRIPISYCLGWPDRLELELPNLDLTKIGSLNFSSVEPTRYPCLELAIDAARMDRSVPAVLNGANEAVVESYLNGHLHFVEIAKLLQDVMSGYQSISQKPDCPSYLRDIQTLEDAVKADQWGREEAQQRMQERVAA